MKRAACILVAFACALSLSVASRAQSPAPTFASVMAGLAQTTGFVAQFREEKTIELLAAPLRSEGTLYFAPPNHLARRITRPASSAMVVDGDRVRMLEGHAIRELDGSQDAAIGAFVRSFVQLLSGNRVELERTFVVAFTATGGSAWNLRLTPRDARLGRLVREIRAAGAAQRLQELVVVEGNGDTSTSTFTSFEARSLRASDPAFQLRAP